MSTATRRKMRRGGEYNGRLKRRESEGREEMASGEERLIIAKPLTRWVNQ